jgi:hypothetical protein
MKSMLIVTALVIMSGNVFASSVVQTALAPFATSALTTLGPAFKQAQIIVNDAQEYLQTGTATTFLAQKISEIQAEDSAISDSEALEILLENAQIILDK